MKNADMPAMPLSGDAYHDFAGYVPGKTSFNPECQGLTKREYAAIKIMAALASQMGTGADPNYASRYAVKWANALMSELNK